MGEIAESTQKEKIKTHRRKERLKKQTQKKNQAVMGRKNAQKALTKPFISGIKVLRDCVLCTQAPPKWDKAPKEKMPLPKV